MIPGVRLLAVVRLPTLDSRPMAPMSVIKIEKMTVRFGGITAVNEVDLTVEEGQIFSVIGPNGAGKTTVFNAITGIYEPTEGTVQFQDQPLVRPFTRKVGIVAAL